MNAVRFIICVCRNAEVPKEYENRIEWLWHYIDVGLVEMVSLSWPSRYLGHLTSSNMTYMTNMTIDRYVVSSRCANHICSHVLIVQTRSTISCNVMRPSILYCAMCSVRLFVMPGIVSFKNERWKDQILYIVKVSRTARVWLAITLWGKRSWWSSRKLTYKINARFNYWLFAI